MLEYMCMLYAVRYISSASIRLSYISHITTAKQTLPLYLQD